MHQTARAQLIAMALSAVIAFAVHPFVTIARDAVIATEIVRIDSPVPGLQLALHHRFPRSTHTFGSKVVLFAEGSAVPTAGNAAFKINGVSWIDSLARSKFSTNARCTISPRSSSLPIVFCKGADKRNRNTPMGGLR
jgi:hypothetical protein